MAPDPTCRGCRAPITWAVTQAKGRRIPLNLEPADDGNLLMTGAIDAKTGAPIVRAIARDEVVAPARARYLSHFATCPTARTFRKKTKTT